MPFAVALLAVALLFLAPQEAEAQSYNQPTPEDPLSKYDVVENIGGVRARLLFWQEDQDFGDPDWLEENRQDMQELQSEGIRPLTSIFRWPPAFYESRPESDNFRSEWPAHQAWYEYLDARRDLMMRQADGSTISGGGGVFGYINPTMPLPEEDWPDYVEEGPYYDYEWEASRIASFAEASGVRGVGLADGADMMPQCGAGAINCDFNPRIIDDFEEWAGISVPGSSISERASYIKSNHFQKWVDYWTRAYALFQQAVVDSIEARTGEDAFVQTQAPHSGKPSDHRLRGYDSRVIMEGLEPDEFLQTVQVWLFGDRAWGISRVPLLGAYHARQPNLVRGAMMPTYSDLPIQHPESLPNVNADRFFWGRTVGVDGFLSGDLSSDDYTDAELTEMGKKRMREMWTYLGWTHLANTEGTVERAIEYVTGGGHSEARPGETVPQEVWDAFQEIRPAAPYGPAGYYSVPIEKSFEENMNAYHFSSELVEFVEDGSATPLYYVSDLTLGDLDSESEPTSWVIPEADRLSGEERSQLEAIAPIYDPANEEGSLASPYRFEGDATGSAFVDQDGNVIVVASRRSMDKGTQEITVQFDGLSEDGTFEATGVFDTDQSYDIEISDGSGTLTFELEQWQTRAFRTNLPMPKDDLSGDNPGDDPSNGTDHTADLPQAPQAPAIDGSADASWQDASAYTAEHAVNGSFSSSDLCH